MDDLRTISAEMDNLARKVAREQVAPLRHSEPTWSQIDLALKRARIPLAA